MTYRDQVSALAKDPEQLEQAFRQALQAGEADAFKQAIDDVHAEAPDNLLYAAWFHRLKDAAVQAKRYVVAWAWVVPLAAANALLFWWLSGQSFMITIENSRGIGREVMPTILILAAPLCTAFLLVYFTVVGRKRWRLSALIGILLLAAGVYVLLFYPRTVPGAFQEQYLILMAMHLPLLAWAGVGLFLLARHADSVNRFRFLIKSFEVFILGGLFVIADGLFTGITIGLFEALNVEFPEVMLRLFIAGGAGMIPVVAAAVLYNPGATPAEQAFDEGLSKMVALLMRILLPLTLLVLLVYLAFIPFNFWAPFENRDVLIIYNGMLFAVVALLVGATPMSLDGTSARLARWLRLGIVAVAALALLVSLYALSAILYRTSLDRLTPNRLAFIGWNVVNIGLLVLMLLFQARAKAGRWTDGLYRAYSIGTVAYALWTAAMVIAIPWLFGISQGQIEALPEAVQDIVRDEPAPILLKCSYSPHIYLLDGGEKRWIGNIEALDDRGYVWQDVRLITCADLRNIPDGVPIPANAGPPPQP
jgi:hypothetical protein